MGDIMAVLGSINESDLFLKITKTLDGNFRVMNCYKKGDIDYLYSSVGEPCPTAAQAILKSGYQESEVINNYI